MFERLALAAGHLNRRVGFPAAAPIAGLRAVWADLAAAAAAASDAAAAVATRQLVGPPEFPVVAPKWLDSGRTAQEPPTENPAQPTRSSLVSYAPPERRSGSVDP